MCIESIRLTSSNTTAQQDERKQVHHMFDVIGIADNYTIVPATVLDETQP